MEEKKKIEVRVPVEWDEYRRENFLNWIELIGLGIQAKKENPNLLKRIKELETKINLQERKLNNHIQG